MRRLPFFLIMVLLAACGGDGDTPSTPAGGNDLEDVALGADTGSPLGRVQITGLTGEPWEYQIEIVDASGEVRSGAPILSRDGGGHEFPVPFHPDDPAGGGAVQLRITRGTESSESVEFRIEPLPTPAGGLSALVDMLSANLSRRAGLFGTTTSALEAAPWDSLAPNLVALKLAHTLLEGSDNQNSLRELAAGRAPLLEEGTVDVDLLDRLVDHLGILAIVAHDDQQLEQLGPPPAGTGAKGTGEASRVRDNTVDIGSAEQLDWYMGLARSSEFALSDDSASRQFHEDLGMAMTLLGIVPHPSAQVAAAGVATVQYAYTTARQAMAKLLPSEFSDLKFEVTHDWFNEDSGEMGEWSAVDAYAVSQGWRADEAVVDGLLLLASLGRAHGDWLNRFESITQTGWLTNARNFILDTTLRLLNAIGQNQVVEFRPETYGPVDITGMPWSYGTVLTDKILIPTDLSYVPFGIGEDELEIRTGEDLYGGASYESSKPVEVRQIEVTLLPEVIVLDEAGELVQVQATIENANDKTLEWDIGPASWDVPPAGVGSGTELGTIRTPATVAAYDFVIQVRSTSDGGLRASSDEPRAAARTVRLGDVAIELVPSFVYVSAGDSVQFEPIVSGLLEGEYELAWSVSSGSGSISQEGLYIAPFESPSSATVSANIVGQPEIIAYADIEVVENVCYYSISVSGNATFVEEGVQVAYTLEEFDDTYIFQLWLDIGDNFEQAHVTIGDNSTAQVPRTGSTGVFEVSFSFQQGTERWFSARGTDSGEVFLELEDFTATHMVGRIVGTAVGRDAEGRVDPSDAIQVDMTFRAPHWVAFDNWPCDGNGPF